LFSKPDEAAAKLHKGLSQIPGYKVNFESNSEVARELLTKGAIGSVVFSFQGFGIVQVALIRSICEGIDVPQVLVFADTTDEGIRDTIFEDKNIILIEKSLINVDKDIAGLCVRLLENIPKFSRESVRHATQQVASVIIESGKHYDSRLTNMSAKGACLEVNTNVVKVNETIKLSIVLDKLNRRRVILAEVRWIKPFPGRSIIGVRFKTEE